MDNTVNERDYALLETDKYTFAVLKRIIGGPCRVIRTDHESVIICHSTDPFPVWIWTPDGCPDEVKERAYVMAEELCPLTGGHTYNLKYELADYFIARAEKDGTRAAVTMNIKAYECPEPIRPDKAADGKLYRCASDDVNEAAELISRFTDEIQIDRTDRERYVEKAKSYIDGGLLYFWKDAQDDTVACCLYTPNDGIASVGTVFTFPEHRRKHYAENLVYEVTRIAKNAGYTPMLYTNSDYAASNACYMKIGYRLRGTLCTVGARQDQDKE